MNKKATGQPKANEANGRPASKRRGVHSPTSTPQPASAEQNPPIINATPKKVDAPPPTNGDCWLNLAFYKKNPPKLNPLTRTLQKWPRMDPANRTFNYLSRRRYNTDEDQFDTIIQDLQIGKTFTQPSPTAKAAEIPDNDSILKTTDGYSIVTEKIPLVIFGDKAKIADLAALKKALNFYSKNSYDKFDNNCLFFQKEYTSRNKPFFPSSSRTTQNTDPNNPQPKIENLDLVIDIDQSHKNSLIFPIKKIGSEVLFSKIFSIDSFHTATDQTLSWVLNTLNLSEPQYDLKTQSTLK